MRFSEYLDEKIAALEALERKIVEEQGWSVKRKEYIEEHPGSVFKDKTKEYLEILKFRKELELMKEELLGLSKKDAPTPPAPQANSQLERADLQPPLESNAGDLNIDSVYDKPAFRIVANRLEALTEKYKKNPSIARQLSETIRARNPLYPVIEVNRGAPLAESTTEPASRQSQALEKMITALLEIKNSIKPEEKRAEPTIRNAVGELRKKIKLVADVNVKNEGEEKKAREQIAEVLFNFMYEDLQYLKDDVKKHFHQWHSWTKWKDPQITVPVILEKFEESLKAESCNNPELAEKFYEQTFNTMHEEIEQLVIKANEDAKKERTRKRAKHPKRAEAMAEVRKTGVQLLDKIRAIKNMAKEEVTFEKKLALSYQAAYQLRQEVIKDHAQTYKKKQHKDINTDKKIEKTADFTFILVKKENLDQEWLEKLSQNRKVPILIKNGDQIQMFGFSASQSEHPANPSPANNNNAAATPLKWEWKITNLDSSLFRNIKFQIDGHPSVKRSKGLSTEIKQELAKAHDEFEKRKIPEEAAVYVAFKTGVQLKPLARKLALVNDAVLTIDKKATEASPISHRDDQREFQTLINIQDAHAKYLRTQAHSYWLKTLAKAWQETPEMADPKDKPTLQLLRVYNAFLTAKLEMLTQTSAQKTGRSKLHNSSSLKFVDNVIASIKEIIEKQHKDLNVIIEPVDTSNMVTIPREDESNRRCSPAPVEPQDPSLEEQQATTANETLRKIKTEEGNVEKKYYSFFGIRKRATVSVNAPAVPQANARSEEEQAGRAPSASAQ